VVSAHTARQDRDRREAAWDAAADETAGVFAAGAGTVAFATIGDPNVYSTFTYLAATVRARVPGLTVTTVPGITAMQDLAARSGTVLCEGTETLALLPLTAGMPAFREALATHDTVVGYKSGRHLPEVLAAVREAGRLDGAVHGACLGLPGEDIRPAAEVTGPAPYLSVLLVPGQRASRGGKL
jgi:precorrin-2/cobalt-factor-2 C20-methyltransferase